MEVPTLAEIEKIGFREFVLQVARTTHRGSYSESSDGDKALALLGAIKPILASKGLTYRQYFEQRPVEHRRFLELCGMIAPEEDRYQSRRRPRYYPD